MKTASKRHVPWAVIFATVMLVVIFAFVCVNTFLLSRIIDGIKKEVSTTKLEYSDFNELHNRFLKKRTYLSITVNHDDIAEVEREFAEILGALRIDDTETAAIAKSRLLSALQHLGRLSGFNIDSVI